MEIKKRDSLAASHPPGLLSNVTDLEVEHCFSSALSEVLAHGVNVTMLDTSRRGDAHAMTFEVSATANPIASLALRGLTDTDLGRVLSESLSRQTERKLVVMIRRRAYGFSVRPARSLLEPIRLSIYIEAANSEEFLKPRMTA
jgi:hypothetical protein